MLTQHRVLTAAQASKDVENRQEVKALSALLQVLSLLALLVQKYKH